MRTQHFFFLFIFLKSISFHAHPKPVLAYHNGSVVLELPTKDSCGPSRVIVTPFLQDTPSLSLLEDTQGSVIVMGITSDANRIRLHLVRYLSTGELDAVALIILPSTSKSPPILIFWRTPIVINALTSLLVI